MTPEGPRDDGSGDLVDADAFLDLTARLREAHGRLGHAGLSAAELARWQHRLVAITDTAARDLSEARVRLRRLERDLGRQLDA